VDGVGGTLKRAVWRRILQKRVVLNTAEEFAAVAREACPNVSVLFVGKSEVEEVKVKLEKNWAENMPKVIPDTHGTRHSTGSVCRYNV